MAPPSGPSESAALLETASSTLTLLRRFSATLIDPNSPSAEETANPPDPLDVLHDAAKLLKAHTTKLSLLVINKPFTPSAIRKIIAQVTSTCLPGLMGAVELCSPSKYGRILNGEVKFRVRKVFREFEDMMEEVMSISQEMQDGNSSGSRSARSRKDNLASTGVVWEACDSLIELKAAGMVGLVVQKAQDYRAMLEDALTELREWGEDEVDEDEEDDEEDSDENDDADSIEDMLSGAERLPKARTDLRATLDSSLKKLKLVSTLYQALIKRRMRTIGSGAPGGDTSGIGEVASRVDGIMDILKAIPDQTDELASAFYDLDNEEALKVLEEVCGLGRQAVELAHLDWSGQEDEFSTWSDKWNEAIGKA